MRTINIRSVLAVLLTAICVCAKGQTAAQNYVKAETSVNDNGGKVTSVEYYDGLGRPVLTVTNGQGSNYVYQRRRYDYGDRISEQYIPAYGNTQPLYKDSTALNWLYSSDPYKSTHTTYDGLGRQTVVKGPGKLWHDNSRYVTTAYGLNAASEVRLYKVSGNSLTLSGYYAAGTLSVEQVTDENKHVTKIYKDMQDRVVLECRNSSYYTYYVYDYLGNLRYVLPPLAADALTATSTTWSSGTAAIKRYGYYYEYDSRNRCTKKQLPGCDYVTMTYDTCDRLTGSQDGNQRQSNTSTYYEYDNLGRQKVMGTKDASGTKTPLIETFYDDYSFLTTAESNKVGFHTSNGYESSKADAKGLQTGSRVHQLDSPSTYTVTAMYYNSYGEMIQSRSTNHRSGNDDQYVQYNHLTGKELKRKHIHSASSQTTRTEIYSYEYNASDQLKKVSHKLDNNAEKVLYTLTYDNYGRVSNKSVMGNKESIAFQYNIRDWLTNISSTRFTEQIAYNATNGNAVPSTACYNGNIAAISWKAGTETAFRTAKFTYNNLDWLTGSTYSGTGKYTTSYTYDKMGNIKTIQRNGLQDGSTYGLIDNLTFTYTGNQVTKIEDAVNDPTYNGAFNFNDGVSQAGEYAYDKNGNMTKDLNKKISSIKYNFLNLPSSITYSTGKSATYIYDASGKKLQTSYKASSSATAQPTDYCGNMIYENNVLKQILIDGGYITFNGSTPVYHYYLQDHQGNNRVVCNASGTVEQVNHYYPFGGLYGQSTNGDTQRFKYNGKELDRMHGLDLYDYGARHYDAAIGRFTTVDPLAEKYYSISPYAYCGNDPINCIDPSGMKWENPKDSLALANDIQNTISRLEKNNTNNEEKLKNRDRMSSKKIARLEGRIAENNERIGNLKKSADDVKLLGDDMNHVYAIEKIGGGKHHVVQKEGKVYIETSSTALTIHEMTHISQSLSHGGLNFDENGLLKNAGATLRMKSDMEIEAYQRQYSYDLSFPGNASSLSGINYMSVGNITDDGVRVYPFIHQYYMNQQKQMRINKKMGF